jgi:polygalacturonase
VDGITIFSRANINGDGIDFDGCSKVRVSNSTFDTSDGSLCQQTSLPENPCQDVLITNCSFSSRWAGIQIGLLSSLWMSAARKLPMLQRRSTDSRLWTNFNP